MTSDPLEVARKLIELGVPVFIAPPASNPTAGVGGYWLPKGWEQTVPDVGVLEAWKPGWALCAVGGHAVDFLDLDPRNGSDASFPDFQAAGLMPQPLAVASTPSGGLHFVIPATGVKKGALADYAGIDLQAGEPDGSGRGFVFISPTEKLSKTTGELGRYRWLSADGLSLSVTSGSEALAEYVRSSRSRPSTPKATIHPDATIDRCTLGEWADYEMSFKLREVLAEIGTPIEYGTHDETLTRYAAALVSNGCPHDLAVDLLRKRADEDCVPPWGGPDDVADKVLSAWDKMVDFDSANVFDGRHFGPRILCNEPGHVEQYKTNAPQMTPIAHGHLAEETHEFLEGICLPSGYSLPDMYYFDVIEGKPGIIHRIPNPTEKDKNRVKDIPICVGGYFFPVCIGEDPDSGTVVWVRYHNLSGDIIEKVVPLASLRGRDRLMAALGDYGVPFNGNMATAVVDFVGKLLVRNKDIIPEKRIARVLGWQDCCGMDAFVSSSEETGTLAVKPYHQEQDPACKAHLRGGSSEGWRLAIEGLEPHHGARTALAAAFAAPLLIPLGINPFTVDIAGTTSSGKTSAAEIALSVWADPSAGAGAMGSWGSTAYAIELRLNLSHGVLVVLDESQKAKNNPEILRQVLYMSGLGKTRGGDWASGLKTSTVTVSTGEQSVLDFIQGDAGAAARVLPIRVAPFNKTASDFNSVGKLIAAAKLNHGHAGPEFAAWLIQMRDVAGGWDWLKIRHAGIVEEIRLARGSNQVAQRRSAYIAQMILAERLACLAGILPYAPMTLDEWIAVIEADAEATAAEEDRGGQAFEVLTDWVVQHPDRFVAVDGNIPVNTFGVEAKTPFAGYAGRWTEHEGERCVALFREEAKRVLQAAGFQLDAVIPAWKEAGRLISGDSQVTKVIRMPGGSKRMLVLRWPY